MGVCDFESPFDIQMGMLFLISGYLFLLFFQNLLKAAGATQKQLGLVRLHEQTKKNLEQEIQVRQLSKKSAFLLF